MRNKLQAIEEMEEEEEYYSDDGPHLLDLERVARAATKSATVLKHNNEVLQDEGKSGLNCDLKTSEGGAWEERGIPVKEFEKNRATKMRKESEYDLWANLSILKADINFGQLLESSPMARRPWLRMADAIVDWGGSKPSITYGPRENRAKVRIGSLTSAEVTTSLDEQEERNEKVEKNDTLVGVVNSGGKRTTVYLGLSNLGSKS
ncbi:hypothetical protein AXG93_4783s1010 [Marchantia polymorpha subsp. ruderalis]|uniref:Uncharacterized protein n=1 Tax=Marchantia polymorpha subsp. ruderalis TaxID=1480154 RepID=A0A176WKU6_MARPO|nr:hypothetical protein AXG93_4783s1010 [Marchantia polymorpha subsp. ruderalis]